MNILYVRSGLYNSTNAILRAVVSAGDLFSNTSILCWNRRGEKLPKYTKDSMYGDIYTFNSNSSPRSLRSVTNLFLYQMWVFKNIVKLKPNLVQCLDFESIVPAIFSRILVKHEIVYDMRDPFALSYNFPRIIRFTLRIFDNFLMLFCAGIILPADERKSYLYKYVLNKSNIQVILNTCSDELPNLVDFDYGTSSIESVKIVFAGYLSHSRAGELLLDLCKESNGDVEILLAGRCDFEDLNKKIENCDYAHDLGMLPHLDVLSLMKSAHLVSLLYDPNVPVNRMAAPNKFYESLCMGTPVLVSRGMSISNIVEDNRLGWVIDYADKDQLNQVVNDLKCVEKLNEMRRRCREYFMENCLYSNEKVKYYKFYKKTFLS